MVVKAQITMNKIVTTILLAILFSACTSKYEAEIEQAKEMKQKVELAKEELNQVDINEVAQAKDQYTQDIAVFKHKYKPDTVNQAEANMMTTYKYIKKGAKVVIGSYQDVKKDVELSESQLEKLIYDMEHELWDENEVKTYMKEEMERGAEVISNVKNMKETHDKLIQIYDSLSPKVAVIVDSLKRL